ncbi:MAG: GCN5-related N-acetyltransferase [Chloroflexi bacterium]|nr:GCN5-related N-acetyltransferase [Chloroflexota bacterium]
MPAKAGTSPLAEVTCRPVTADRWSDFEQLFGERGACAGCWCMYLKLPRATFDRQKGAENKEAIRAEIIGGGTPGLLAYAGDEPAGWCAIAPRDAYPALARSRILKPVDESPVWSVTCFFVARPYRRQGLAARLLRAAVDHAATHGATIVEGYPVDSRQDKMPDTSAWMGLASTFQAVGFTEVARRSESRPIMRYRIGKR